MILLCFSLHKSLKLAKFASFNDLSHQLQPLGKRTTSKIRRAVKFSLITLVSFFNENFTIWHAKNAENQPFCEKKVK